MLNIERLNEFRQEKSIMSIENEPIAVVRGRASLADGRGGFARSDSIPSFLSETSEFE